MLDSDFWRDLAERFRRLDPDGILQAGWTFPFGHQSSELWEVFGTGDLGPSIRVQFEPLAIRAGLKLDPESTNPVDVWLTALKASGPQIDLIGPTGAMVQESGCIRRLCQVSADHCNLLELRALQTEHASNTGIQVLQREFESPIEFKSLVPPSVSSVAPEVLPPTSEIAREPEILPSVPEEPLGPEVLPTASEPLPQLETPPSSLPSSASEGEKRRQRVDAFLRECNKISDVRVLRQHIWLSISHSTARQFEYWQRADSKATAEDNRNFSRILRTTPEEFIATLKQQGHIT